jgi:uncharacterized protein (TIGR03437 family)
VSTIAGGAPPPTPSIAALASVAPRAVAADDAGNFYFVSNNSVLRVDKAGTLTRVAGTSRRGFSGDGGPATQAQLNSPWDLAVDDNGNLFIADTSNNRVRKVTADGIITTVAGSGWGGFWGDGGPAVYAGVGPVGIALDHQGNLYIADGSNRIRKVTPDGVIQTTAGNGQRGSTGDGGRALDAALASNSVSDVAVDSSGNVYFSTTGRSAGNQDVPDNRIRMISTDGTITTIAGTGPSGTAGDNGPAIAAQLTMPFSLAIDQHGNIFVADYWRVRKVATDGRISTIAGGTFSGFSGDGGPAVKAQFSAADSIAVNADGEIFIADVGNKRIRKIAADGAIATVAGAGVASFSGDGGPAIDAQLDQALSVAVDADANVYIADFVNSRVRRVGRDGVISTIAGGGQASPRAGAAATGVALGRVAGVLSAPSGDLYIADTDNACVWKVAPDQQISRFAGTGYSGYGGDDGIPAAQSALNTPWGLAMDRFGNIYIADENQHRVRKVVNGVISTVAGNGTRGDSGDGGPATSASLDWPRGIAVDADGSLYIADYSNSRIRKVTPDGIIRTVAGTGQAGWTPEGGKAAEIAIGVPEGLALDADGNLYFSDSLYIRKLSPDGTLTTVAGSPTSDSCTGDWGPALEAGMRPKGIALGPGGNIYMAAVDAVRVLQPVSPAVRNLASNTAGAVSPGEIVVLSGTELGPTQLVPGVIEGDRYATQLAGTVVKFNGVAAPLLYSSNSRVAAVTPYGISGPTAEITVEYLGHSAAAFSVPVFPATPGIFTLDPEGTGQATALNQDGTLNGPFNPAKVGDIVVLFATGGGAMVPSAVDGAMAGAPFARPVLPVLMVIGGQTVIPEYAGAFPGQINGMMQLKFKVPPGVPLNASVTLLVGGSVSQPGVTIWVH